MTSTAGASSAAAPSWTPRELREEGLHFVAPWDELFIYDLRLQATTEKINAISKDGVAVTAQINVRYQLAHRAVAVLHKFIGPQYLETVITPEIGSQAREVISKFKFRIESEAQESKRKQIEANGIAAFQQTVSKGISDSYLRWRGIDATVRLAQSPNAKIVVIGAGKDGLPIILNSDRLSPAAQPSAAAEPPPPSN